MNYINLTNEYDIAVKTLTMHGYIVGGSGSGKSVTIQKLMEELFNKTKTLTIVLDSKGDLNKIRASEGMDDRHIYLWDTAPKWDKTKNFGNEAKIQLSIIPVYTFIDVLELTQAQNVLFISMLNYYDQVWMDGKQGKLWSCLDNPNTLIEHLDNVLGKFKANNAFNQRTYDCLVAALKDFSFRYNDYFVNYATLVPKLDAGEACFTLYQDYFHNNDFSSLFIVNVSTVKSDKKLYQIWVSYILNCLRNNYVDETSDLKVSLFIDEAHQLFGGEVKSLVNDLEDFVATMRSKGVSCWFITQNVNSIPVNITTNLGTLIHHKINVDIRGDLGATNAAKAFDNINEGHELSLGVKHYKSQIKRLQQGEAYVISNDEDGAVRIVDVIKIDAPECINNPIIKNNYSYSNNFTQYEAV